MKKVEWQNKLPGCTLIGIQKSRYKPGSTGHATYKNIDVLLEITENENDLIFHAKVIGFDPPTSASPGLEIGDEVEVGIQHFIPD